MDRHKRQSETDGQTETGRQTETDRQTELDVVPIYFPVHNMDVTKNCVSKRKKGNMCIKDTLSFVKAGEMIN